MRPLEGLGDICFLQVRHRLGDHPGYFSIAASGTVKGLPHCRQVKVGTVAL
jgi:hypothetical protein